MAYLTNAILKKPKTLIHTPIQKIIVYEDKVEIFYNYTDETNPGDDSPRDLSYYSGSDSSVIPGSNTTNPNQKSKPPVELVVCIYPKRVNYQPTR